MLGPLCNQTVNLKTDSKNLYHSVLKLKYSLSISKHNKGWKIYALLSNSHNAVEITGTVRIYLQTHMFILTDWSLDACHELVCIFKDFFASGMQDVELTKSLSFLVLLMGMISKWCNTTIEKTLNNTQNTIHSYVQCLLQRQEIPSMSHLTILNNVPTKQDQDCRYNALMYLCQDFVCLKPV